MSIEPFQTAEGQDYPGCRQLSVFLENRLGQLLRVTRLLEDQPIRIVGLSVEGTVDCAILRLVVDDADAAREILTDAGFAVSETELVIVELPPGKRAIMIVCAALIGGEVNINYAYTLWAGEDQRPALAIQVDSMPNAVSVLVSRKFTVLRQSDL